MQTETTTWPELAIGIYDQLTKRNAEITYEFKDLTIGVPRAAEPTAPQAKWTVSGSLYVRTRNVEPE